jgi:hypothetical protein
MEHARFAPSPSGPRPHWWRLAAFVFTLAALLAGCAQATTSPTFTTRATEPAAATATTALLPTPFLPAQLQWHMIALPPGVGGGYTAAPSDGAASYTCLSPDISGDTGHVESPRVWSTHDFAAHWTRMANIPADKVNNECVIQVDALNPAIVVAVLIWLPNGAGGGPDINDMSNFVTCNGGASWRKVTSANPFNMDLMNPTATRNGMTYAIRSVLRNNVV